MLPNLRRSPFVYPARPASCIFPSTKCDSRCPFHTIHPFKCVFLTTNKPLSLRQDLDQFSDDRIANFLCVGRAVEVLCPDAAVDDILDS